VDENTEPVLVAATPQTLPVAAGGFVPQFAMVGLGLAMILAAVLPPLVGKRARPALPVPGGRGTRGLSGGASS
jgi:hypothetical protein